MVSTYTNNNGIELIADGEQSGTWGSTTNDNLTFIDTSLDGQITVTLTGTGTSGSPNTLDITDGTTSDGRNRFVLFDDGGDLGGTAYVQLTPNEAEKVMIVENGLSGSRSILLFQGTYSGANDYELKAGARALVRFDGAGASAVVTRLISDVGEDDSISVTGGTLDGVTIGGTTPAAGTFTDLTASGTIDFTGATVSDLGTVTTADIDGGTIDGATIGGTSAGAGTFTDITGSGTIDFTGATVSDLGTVTTADIDGGTLDGATIGGTTPAAGSFTDVDATGQYIAPTNAGGSGLGNVSYSFDGENTGMYHIGTNNLGFATSGTKRIDIASGGDVTVTDDLIVEGSGLRVYDGGAGDNGFVRVAANRTVDGQARLDLVGASGTTFYDTRLIRFGGTNAITALDHTGTGELQITTEDAADIVFSTSATEAMRISSSGVVTMAATLLVSGNTMKVGDDGSGFMTLRIGEGRTDNNVSRIDLISTLGVSDYDFRILRNSGANGDTEFLHSGTGDFILDAEDATDIGINTNGSRRVTIKSGGGVGIGTTAPDNQFHVFGSAANRMLVETEVANTNDSEFWYRKSRSGGQITAGDDLGTTAWYGHDGTDFANAASITVTSTTNTGDFDADMTFQSHGFIFENMSGTDTMVMTSGGDVGIGTSSPGSRLSIVGLPTSSTGLSAGDVWDDAGTLKIVQ